MKKQSLPYWEFDPNTGGIALATWSPGSVFISSSPEWSESTTTWILDRKEGMKYFQALNLKNAQRKAKKNYLIPEI